MSPIELIRLVIHNLLRMRARVVMTSLGVMIGTAAVVILLSLGEGMQQQSLKFLEQMGSMNDINVFPNGGPGGGALKIGNAPGGEEAAPSGGSNRRALLTDKSIADLRAIAGVQAAGQIVSLDNGQPSLSIGRLEGYAQIFGLPLDQIEKLGFAVQTGTLRLGAGTVLVGASVGEQFNDPLEMAKINPNELYIPRKRDLTGKTIEMLLQKSGTDGELVERVVKVRVAGTLKAAGFERDPAIFMSQNDISDFSAWFSENGTRPNYVKDGYQRVLVRAKSVNNVEAVVKDIRDRGFNAFSQLDQVKSIRQQGAVVQAVLGGVGAVALLVAAFGIANTMVMAIYERTREIGLMKAVGATDRDVLLVFLSEAAAIGFIGGVFGLLLGYVAGQILGSVLASTLGGGAPPDPTSGPLQLFVLPAWLPLFSIGFAALIGLVSGLYPALRATRLDPINALRQP